MAAEPLDDLGVLVGGVVVDDGVHQLAGWHPGLDGIEEADELLVAVTLHAAADDVVERGEQGGGAVPLVVLSHRAAAATLERQARLGAVEQSRQQRLRGLQVRWLAVDFQQRATRMTNPGQLAWASRRL
jgi:hypothetical protein